MLVIRAEIHKMLVRFANRNVPAQTGSSKIIIAIKIYLSFTRLVKLYMQGNFS